MSNSMNDYELDTLKSVIINKLKVLKMINDEPVESTGSYNISTFKKIKYGIDILNNSIKYLILKTNDDKYTKDIKDNTIKIEIPTSIDKLVLLISYYDKSFDAFVIQKLYDIVDLDFFQELYSIYTVNDNLIQYVADDSISYSDLNTDFNILYKNIIDFCCYIFTINTDFEETSYFE